MEMKEIKIDDGIVVEIHGRFDSVSSGTIQKKLTDLMEENEFVIVDLNNTEHISSNGVRVLVILTNLAQKAGNSFCLISVPRHILETLDVTGFRQILHIYPNLETAVHSFKAGLD